jgi:hypothetical protein
MNKYFEEIFSDEELIKKIQRKLPVLFKIAEIESSRADKIGMQVGSIRENIISALLIYKFGEKNIDTEIPITEAETDVYVYKQPLSIKTISNPRLTGIKLSWTVDAKSANQFLENYQPKCDILLISINWNNIGFLYYITKELQIETMDTLGKNNYLKLPVLGTNPRGVELTGEAARMLANHKNTYKIKINWKIPQLKINPFKRWVDLWQEE